MRITFNKKVGIDKIYCLKKDKLISMEQYNKCKICHVEKYGDNGSQSTVCLTSDKLWSDKLCEKSEGELLYINDVDFYSRIKKLNNLYCRDKKLGRILYENN